MHCAGLPVTETDSHRQLRLIRPAALQREGGLLLPGPGCADGSLGCDLHPPCLLCVCRCLPAVTKHATRRPLTALTFSRAEKGRGAPTNL